MPAKKKAPTAAQQRAASENKVHHKRSAALSVLQMAGRWEPFVGASGKVFWKVPSERVATAGGNGPVPTYTVYVEPGALGIVSCTCPNFASTHLPCKHITALRTMLRVVSVYNEKHRPLLEAMHAKKDPRGRAS